MLEHITRLARRGFDLKQLDIERFLQRLGQSMPDMEPASNPFLSLHLQKTFGAPTDSRIGRIQSSMPFFGWYRVAVEGMGGVVPCCRLSSDCSPSLYGVIDTVTLPPDCAVMVQIHPTLRWGFISGVIPSVQENGNFCFSDWVVQGSHVGYRERYHAEPVTQTKDEGGLIDFSNNRPMDNLTTDWDRVTTTGLAIHLDPFLAYMRVSEVCGVFAFYPEEVLRFAGRELQVMSAVHVENYMNDEGELTYYRGETPYPWEMLGGFEKDATVHKEVTDEDVHDKRVEGKFEPSEKDQKPIIRYEEYGGYLGQGRIRQMAVPVPESSQANKYDTGKERVGVFREFVGLDGEYFLGTAKGLTLAKTCMIPIAERKRLQSDQREDSDNAEADNYRFAGTYGEGGDEHKLAEIENENEEHKLLASALGSLDAAAYLTNWKSLLAFHYHKKDFKTPQEGAGDELKKSQEELDFYKLKDGYNFDQPTAKEVKIDERLTAKFYQLLSLIKLTDDGNLILQGGYGPQIRFVGGDIYIDAPGHIHLRSGKSTVVLAGDDAVIKARNSFDISSTEKDGRIKTEKNFMVLAANGGKGALMLESRASGSEQNYPSDGGEKIEGSGIILKAAKSIISTMSGDLYLRTGNTKGGINNGKIVFDASKGESDIISIASSHQRFSKSDCVDSFGFPKVNQINRYGSNETLLGGSLRINGSADVKGSLDVMSGVRTAQGHFQSPSAGDVGRLREPGLVKSELERIDQDCEQEKEQRTTAYKTDVEQELRGSNKIGGDDTQKKVSFGCRTEQDYATQQFTMPQAHWQLLAASSGATIAWKEKEVKYQDETPTMPWPGKKKWKDEDTFLSLPGSQHTMYDVTGGKAKDRPGSYEEPKFGTFDKKKPESGYLVIDVQ